MLLSTDQVSIELKSNLEKFALHLPLRLQGILEELEHQICEDESVELFNLLVQVLFITDRQPASLIANLMVPLDSEGVSQLEDWTLSSAAALISDYLRKDAILKILKPTVRVP